ncbi:hypothetical protein E1202_25875 [Saccharopolyspora karakumensis]|uniref:Uncharacterized protein n=1 Tax=Saccharopolyspora karakumensis TaxID=2530386 RepID=A0A4R5BHH9_9PSEU|nr:hypothetical protein [Saccharopolyspora karakumensis]TDD83162.1 hypothetical protein E1202_25875 [Saccharopolyspora karakumensis]
MSPEPPEVHRLLLQLAGRMPDGELAVLRTCLADEELDEIADSLISAVDLGLALTEPEVALLTALAQAQDIDAAALAEAPRAGEPPSWRFTGESADDADEAAVRAAERVGGVRALWRSGRVSAETTEPVYLVEAEQDADLVELTAEIQHELTEAGAEPRVEVFHADAAPTRYHDAALAASELVWNPAPPARLARVFDGADSLGTPFFRPDHPRAEAAERKRVLGYLRSAPIAMATDHVMPDVIDPNRTVPLNFRSDGTWVWNDAVHYYLDRYHLAPDPDLVSHVVAASTEPPALDRLNLHRAMGVLTEPSKTESAEEELGRE